MYSVTHIVSIITAIVSGYHHETQAVCRQNSITEVYHTTKSTPRACLDWRFNHGKRYGKATLIKCLDLDDTGGQLGLAVCFVLYTIFNEEASFYRQFGKRGTILLVFLERKPHFMSYLREEALF